MNIKNKVHFDSERRLIYKEGPAPSETPSRENEHSENTKFFAELLEALKDPVARKQLIELVKSFQGKKGQIENDENKKDLWTADMEKRAVNVIEEFQDFISNSTLKWNSLVETQTIENGLRKLNAIAQNLSGEALTEFVSRVTAARLLPNQNGERFFIDFYPQNGKIRFRLTEVVASRSASTKRETSRNVSDDERNSVAYLKTQLQRNLQGIQKNLNHWGYENCPKDHLQSIIDEAARIFERGSNSQDVIDMFTDAKFKDPDTDKKYRLVRDQFGKFGLFESR